MARGRPKKPQSKPGDQSATTGYEADLWGMADVLRGSMDAAEYKHVVLGLLFLKYISDAFEEAHTRLQGEQAEGGRSGRPGRTSTGPRTSSGCRQRPAGRI